jgi:hypothetical protein
VTPRSATLTVKPQGVNLLISPFGKKKNGGKGTYSTGLDKAYDNIGQGLTTVPPTRHVCRNQGVVTAMISQSWGSRFHFSEFLLPLTKGECRDAMIRTNLQKTISTR